MAVDAVAVADVMLHAARSETGRLSADPLTTELRASDGPAVTSRAMPVLAAPEPPRPAIRQIAEALRGGASTIELTLMPEELGRVKLSLAAQDGALHVIVQADRPETVDLLRRSVDVLLDEARAAGFEETSFGFDGSDAGTGDGNFAWSDAGSPAASPDDDAPAKDPVRRLHPTTAGLDLRL